jgi:hypothetical protein
LLTQITCLSPVFRVSINVNNKTIKKVLDEVLTPFNLSYKIIDDVIVISERTEADAAAARPVRQFAKISGKVTDDVNLPLPGVSVRLKGTTIATVTDINGNFILDAPDANGTLVFSFIGFTAKEVPLNGQTSVNAQLLPERTSLNEVIVIGYGTQKTF